MDVAVARFMHRVIRVCAIVGVALLLVGGVVAAC
jgi:hypothetical protein